MRAMTEPLKYQTLRALKEAYESGELDRNEGMLWLDNDTAFVYTGDGNDSVNVYSSHPEMILNEALDLLGIPHEHV